MADFEVPPLEQSPWPTPSRAIYGFVLYVATYVLFGFYLLWALLPDSWLHAIGLTYLPARHWVITFPYLIALGFFLLVVVYYLRSAYLMPSFDETFEDGEMSDFKDLDMPAKETSCIRRSYIKVNKWNILCKIIKTLICLPKRRRADPSNEWMKYPLYELKTVICLPKRRRAYVDRTFKWMNEISFVRL